MYYELYKVIDGNLILWGRYSDPIGLARDAFFLGSKMGVQAIEVIPIKIGESKQ